MPNSLPSFVLGYHGCDEKVADAVISGEESHLRVSENAHDWLGHGIYFWENDPKRALEWAEEKAQGNYSGSTVIETPAVVGAVIDLGYCLNLMERSSIELLRDTYELLEIFGIPGQEDLPENSGGSDRLRRELDCTVLNMVHEIREQYEKGAKAFDSVRALFSEGKPIYPEAGFMEKTHVQVCVRDVGCIKGYFHPKDV